jgi:DNA-binding GntR family transcriptional regulator
MERATGEGHFMNRRTTLFVPSVVLDRTSAVPMHRQIYREVGQAIRDGAVPHDAHLPSTRVMAKLLGVSRNTVLRAYDELAANGLIEGKHGSGMRVCQEAAARGPTLFGLRQVIRESGFPARIVSCEDRDGNALYLRY